MFAQLAQITWMNLKNLPSRLGSSCVIVVGIAGVVGVLVAILAMGTGFAATFDRGGEPDRAVVLRGGSDSELSSGIGNEEMGVVESMEGVLLASRELYTVADVPKRSSGLDANLIVRGVTAEAFAIRDEVGVTQGRRFTPGKGELIAGRGAVAEFAGIDLGATVDLRQTEWKVVGVFEAEGSAYESELWVDLPVAQAAFRRGSTASSMRLLVDAPETIAEIGERVEADPRLDLVVIGEPAFFKDQAGDLATRIQRFGYIVAIIMAIGAVFAALNTMYSAVVTRTVEIATLRAEVVTLRAEIATLCARVDDISERVARLEGVVAAALGRLFPGDGRSAQAPDTDAGE